MGEWRKERLDIGTKPDKIFFSGYPFQIATKSVYTRNYLRCTNQETGIRFNVDIEVFLQ